jgi:DNA-binding transcriptional regulator YdaS (Cro superfamily)
MDILDTLIETAGSKANLARTLGEFPQNIDNWRKRGIPLDKCAGIERATGVPCERLRPDVTWTRDELGAIRGYFVPLASTGQAA